MSSSLRKASRARRAPNPDEGKWEGWGLQSEDWELALGRSLRKSLKRWNKLRKGLASCRYSLPHEEVHDFRVETRRLLSLIDLLKPLQNDRDKVGKVRRLLCGCLDGFAALRDTQVQLHLLDKHRRLFPETKILRRILIHREDRCLEQTSRRVSRIRAKKLRRTVRTLAHRLMIRPSSVEKGNRSRQESRARETRSVGNNCYNSLLVFDWGDCYWSSRYRG